MGVNISIDRESRKITAKITGDLDHHTAKYIRGDIDASIRETNPKTLILDFSAVTFMDSSGIGLVMGRYKIMTELSGEVLIANTPPYIRKVMQLAGLNKLCRIITLTGDDSNKSDTDKNKDDREVIKK
ncbi:MAG: anti-sigma factor antagonist [Oscillospiraceae bacterium]